MLSVNCYSTQTLFPGTCAAVSTGEDAAEEAVRKLCCRAQTCHLSLFTSYLAKMEQCMTESSPLLLHFSISDGGAGPFFF